MPNVPLISRLSPWFSRLWHLPDDIRWMDPLPPSHRRGIIAAALLILLAFLWPAPAPQRTVTPIQSGATDVPLQAELSDAPPPPASTQQQDSQGEWHDFTIASGQTLAQLFRDNNLPVNDVFAMAQVEGDDKPLSTLHAGQAVRIRQDAQGVVTGLTLAGADGEILFTRQPDGTFIKAQ
ncbi:LysM-like peptidoglycan-binding domain-containing protein [Erwinia sorbitola]|uniref:Opacity-associated protein A n=1 Tax=Erwinia sorbitola TaxID=2681984 RepID=A0A6I6EQT7_9GAMM|nr:LysM-like peptidoglycan-binding domain-containing protein [Erwinia sorbitola]MTD27585.1 Opacity-associated protein A [Erwinia sorbitola]QGU89121.1 Opacity-associated protein A [Erwinia sorbitola]